MRPSGVLLTVFLVASAAATDEALTVEDLEELDAKLSREGEHLVEKREYARLQQHPQHHHAYDLYAHQNRYGGSSHEGSSKVIKVVFRLGQQNSAHRMH